MNQNSFCIDGHDEINQYRDPQKEFRSNLRFVAVLLAVVLIFTTVFPRYIYVNIPVLGESMLPTFHAEGDTVGLIKIGKPTYYDVVVIYAQPLSKQIIKRVIGLPGDTIRVLKEPDSNACYIERTSSDGTVTNLHYQDEPYILEPMTKHYGVSYTMAEDEFFLAGDNRNISNDSFDLGPFKMSSLVGRVIFVFNSSGFHIFHKMTSKYAA